ncbi:MAG: serine/threonine protein kinase [Bacteroidales bacterium]|nr:serine/threonine protein kinase [Bacteroidales bacterium]
MSDTGDYLPFDESADSPQLIAAIREYEAALLAGKRPDHREFLARYPDLGHDLIDGLCGLDFLHSAGSRLNASTAGRAPAVVTHGPPETGTLGDFRLIREIGRGGMGVVYEAEQISLGRKVALKVLPFAATLDSRQLRRFENEARAAAQLHHPHVVPVYAVGCERGVHYYAMQLIDGQPLSDVIDRLRQTPKVSPPTTETAPTYSGWTLGGTESRAFFRTVATLGAQAADALEYAHQMGVVHRDIKPANLLVDGRDHLWVTDFGLARVQTAPGMTAPGDLVGTLRYMSPEQARGDPAIDPRSDVYSLGATLYELLTLRPVFSGTDRQACFRQIFEDDPVHPRTWNRAIPVEFETVVLKALAKSPEDRYPSASALADDLRRFLDDRPVAARRPSLRDRAARWSRRHRRAVACVIAALAIAVPVLATTTWRAERAEKQLLAMNEQLRQEQAKTDHALQSEATQRAAAERSFREARKVLDYLTQLGESGLADRPELRPMRRELLEKLLGYYKEFVEQHRDDPATRADLAEAQYRVAAILAEVGSTADAVAAYEQYRRGRDRGLPPPFFRPRGSGLLYLSLQPSVREELQLTEAQSTDLEQYADKRRSHPSGSDDDAAVESHLMQRLTTDQYQRLHQIALQLRGHHALTEPGVAEKLGLSDAQEAKIRRILDDARQRMWTIIGFGPDPDWRTKSEQFWNSVGTRTLTVLTPQQNAAWLEELGPPFTGEIRFRWSPRHAGSSRPPSPPDSKP